MTLATIVHTTGTKLGKVRLALTLGGAVGLSILAVGLASAPSAQAATGLRYHRGYSVQGRWLCYGWNNGTYHCTQHFHRSGGRLISDNPGWVPNVGRAAASQRALGAGKGAPAPAARVQAANNAGEPCRSTQYFSGTPSQWQVPPSCYSSIYSVGNNAAVNEPFGQCTWWPQYRRMDEHFGGFGNAGNWARAAAAHGYRVGSTPAAGATAVFQPGVQGAGGAGHVAHVVAVAPGGAWFLVSEMNFTWRGGGFAKVDYRYAHAGAGVSFIY